MSAKNNLGLRILSGICLGAIAIWGVVWSNFVLNLLLAAGSIIAGTEWAQIVNPLPSGKRKVQYLLPAFLFILFVIGTRSHAPVYIQELAIGSILLFVLTLAPRQIASRYWFTAGFTIVGATILSLLALHQGEHWHALIFLLSCVSATDIGAFAFGKAIGGPKLAPRISPNKTRAGSIGGMIAAVAIAGILNYWLGEGPILQSMAVGLALSILTQAGDLAESALKRRFGVKDSGFLIPGHGGILDRIDGLLLAAPLFTLYRLWLGGPL